MPDRARRVGGVRVVVSDAQDGLEGAIAADHDGSLIFRPLRGYRPIAARFVAASDAA